MSIKYAVLGLLHYSDMYGYEIKNHIENNFGSMWTVNYGQIYNTLKSLVSEGSVIQTEVIPSDTGAPHKKLYSLTNKGRQEFMDWLSSNPERPVLFRDPFMTRFIFLGFGKREDAIRLIDEQMQRAERSLARRKESKPAWKQRGFYSYMARELGISRLEVYVNWLHKVREMIEKKKDNLFDKDSLPVKKRVKKIS